MEYEELRTALARWSAELPLGERLSTLSALVRYWHGAPEGPLAPVASTIALPPGLEWLYAETAARNPASFQGTTWISNGPIVYYNPLRHPGTIEVEESGIYPFLVEQQGVYRCGARPGEADGAVFRQECNETEWRQCADRLSDFLLWWVVFELVVCREQSLWGLFTPEEAAGITGPLTPVRIGKVTTYGGAGSRIYHGEDVVVLRDENSPSEVCLEAVARDDRTLERLQALARWGDE